MEIPIFDGFKKQSLIQYNKEQRHFRTIKFISKRMLVLDGKDLEWIDVDVDQGRLLDDDRWTTYIVGYRRTNMADGRVWNG